MSKTPVWDQAEHSTHEAFAEIIDRLGEQAAEFGLPEIFKSAHEQHRIIMEADLARSFEREYAEGKDKLTVILREMIERGNKVLAVEYNNAVGNIQAFDEVL